MKQYNYDYDKFIDLCQSMEALKQYMNSDEFSSFLQSLPPEKRKQVEEIKTRLNFTKTNYDSTDAISIDESEFEI